MLYYTQPAVPVALQTPRFTVLLPAPQHIGRATEVQEVEGNLTHCKRKIYKYKPKNTFSNDKNIIKGII